jgi:TetR/AcrR family transcriptional repressor of nem operon
MTTIESRHYRKGQEARDRIVRAAAGLMLAKGAQGTTNEAIRREAGVSGSQLAHYFPDKGALLAAVVDFRAASVVELTELASAGGLESFDGIRAWVHSYLDHEEVCVAGCTFGSLAGEIMKTERGLRDHVAAGFDRWLELFRAGLRAMQDRGELTAVADPDALADVLMAAFQGGMLLAQASGESTPLRHALLGALDYLGGFRTA